MVIATSAWLGLLLSAYLMGYVGAFGCWCLQLGGFTDLGVDVKCALDFCVTV